MSDIPGFNEEPHMRLVVAGSRGVTDIRVVAQAIMESGYSQMITEIVCGCARGVDKLGEQLAIKMGIPVKHFPANWDQYGRAAGPIRNEAMGHYCDAAVIVRKDGVSSKGSTSMLRVMKTLNKPVHLKEV